MVQENKTFKPSLGLVVLDAIGALLLGLGLAKMFAGLDILPASLMLDDTGMTFVIIGILLMLPMLIQLYVYIRTQAEKNLTK
jgi:type IV secretory pathway VirB3-like protein